MIDASLVRSLELMKSYKPIRRPNHPQAGQSPVYKGARAKLGSTHH